MKSKHLQHQTVNISTILLIEGDEAGDGTGTELFGAPSGDRIPFLTVTSGTGGLDFGEGRVLTLYYSESDVRFGNWKRIHCSLDHV